MTDQKYQPYDPKLHDLTTTLIYMRRWIMETGNKNMKVVKSTRY
jgi:hypothetical protein